MTQLNLFDCLPEPIKAGDWVEKHGPPIPHERRPDFIGKIVIMDKSTISHHWYKAGILEKYFKLDGGVYYRSVIYDGDRQRQLLTHIPECEIYEPYEETP